MNQEKRYFKMGRAQFSDGTYSPCNRENDRVSGRGTSLFEK